MRACEQVARKTLWRAVSVRFLSLTDASATPGDKPNPGAEAYGVGASRHAGASLAAALGREKRAETVGFVVPWMH